MEKFHFEKAEVIRVCGKSVVFRFDDCIEAYATKRVANDILNGCTDMYIEELAVCMGKQNWLATPSRF